MNIIKKAGLAIVVMCAPQLTLAEVNYISVSAAVWGTDMDGGFEVEALDYTVNTDQFEFDTKASSFFFITVETDNKYAPDMILGITSAKHSAPGSIGFSGTVINVEDGTIDLSHADLSLYYSVYQNDVVDVNLGLTGKYFYGDFALKGLNNGSTQYGDTQSSLTTTLPMLYASVDYQPFTAMNTYLTLQGGSYDGQKGHDISLGVDYIFDNNVGIGLGYRQFETVQSTDAGGDQGLELDVELDIKVTGGFLRVFYQQ